MISHSSQLMTPSPSLGRATPYHELRKSIPDTFLEKSVLVVEDEAMIAWMLESLLEELGFNSVMVSSDAAQARKQAAEGSPGLVVSDINLGANRMDGISLASELNSLAQLPTIFVTGNAGPSERERIKSELPEAVILRKPIAKDELKQAIIHLAEPRDVN